MANHKPVDEKLIARQIRRLTQVRIELESGVLTAEEIVHMCADCLHVMGPSGHGNLHSVIDERIAQIEAWRVSAAG